MAKSRILNVIILRTDLPVNGSLEGTLRMNTVKNGEILDMKMYAIIKT